MASERVPAGTAAAALCIAAGFADAVGYVEHGVFAANMTGNTVLMGLALVKSDATMLLDRGLAIAAFFVGAVTGRWLARMNDTRRWLPVLVEAGMLSLSLRFGHQDPATVWIIAAAMGIQSTILTKFAGSTVSTVVVTGTMSRVAEAVADLLIRPFDFSRPTPATPPGLLLATWAAYGVGAALAAWSMPRMAEPMLIPIAVVTALGSVLAVPTRPAGVAA